MGKLGIGAMVEFCYGESRVIAARIGEVTFHHVISKLGISEAQMIYLSRRSQGEPDPQALPSISGCREKTTAHMAQHKWSCEPPPHHVVGVWRAGICRRVIARERSVEQRIQAQIKLQACVTGEPGLGLEKGTRRRCKRTHCVKENKTRQYLYSLAKSPRLRYNLMIGIGGIIHMSSEKLKQPNGATRRPHG